MKKTPLPSKVQQTIIHLQKYLRHKKLRQIARQMNPSLKSNKSNRKKCGYTTNVMCPIFMHSIKIGQIFQYTTLKLLYLNNWKIQLKKVKPWYNISTVGKTINIVVLLNFMFGFLIIKIPRIPVSYKTYWACQRVRVLSRAIKPSTFFTSIHLCLANS